MGCECREKVLAFWLSSIPGIGPKKIQALLFHFGDLEEIFRLEDKMLGEISCLRERDRQLLQQRRDYTYWKERLEKIQQRGIYFVWKGEKTYPKRLKEIADAPFGLYVRGELPENNKPSVAIVGARQVSREGRELARKFGRELAENGVQVISGLARGVDVHAQRGAMEMPAGRTFGVLGTGIDICYPREHIETYMQIQKQGGLISEYAPGTPGLSSNFPMRNRIISGLSDGILVIEAHKKSGSLITVEAGVEQGKEIFVIPGSIIDPAYQGSNSLLQAGACLVTRVRDILDGMGVFVDEDVSTCKKKNEVMLETPEKIVYAILGLDPVHISEIVERTGFSVMEVMDSLYLLEKKGLISMVGNHYYAVRL